MQTSSAVFPSDLAGTATATPAGHPRRLTAFVGWIGAMFEARRTRRVLAELDPRLLDDIGISRLDALREARRRP
jgi:uncharacterized protein YjiS (DUF1127 family)